MFQLILDVLILLVKLTWEFSVAVVRHFQTTQLEDLSGQIVLITGAAQGIGKELAVQYAQAGCKVVCVDLNELGAKETAKEINSLRSGTAFSYKCDVSNREEVQELANKVSTQIGSINVLVNNAGIVCCRSFEKQTPNQIRKIFDVNVLSHFWTIQAFLPQLMSHKRAQIVGIASVAAIFGIKHFSSYCSTKFAVRGMMEALRNEFSEDESKSGIKLLTICPFFVDTDMVKKPFFKVPSLLGLLQKEDVVAAIIKGHRSGEDELTMPSFLLPALKFISLLPVKCRELLMDFVKSGMPPEED